MTDRNKEYDEALSYIKQLGANWGIDAALKENNLNALVLPASPLAQIPAGMKVILFVRVFELISFL